MAEEKKPAKRKVPTFLRNDWHKKIKLGRTVKKKRKWRGAKGRQNKIRLGKAGHPPRPKIGYSQPSSIRRKIEGEDFVRVENLKQLDALKKGDSIIVASIGAKKKKLILDEAKKKEIKILNKYMDKKK